MDKLENKLKEKFGTKGGWTVPEGYFDAVYKEIEAKLPDSPQPEKYVEMTAWQRIKPYVYLAAMFAGIWLMMKVFYHASTDSAMSLDNPPEQIAMAMSEPDVYEAFSLPDYVSDIELENEVIESYNSIEDFEKDFDYTLESEYKDIDVTE